MQFEENLGLKSLGKDIGFGAGFLFFSSMFFLILSLLHKIPHFIKYWHIFAGVLATYLPAVVLRRILKK